MPADLRVGIHLHLYYADLIKFFVPFLKRVPVEFDLFVSCSGNVLPRDVQAAYRGVGRCKKITVKTVPNVGRDVAPFFCEFAADLLKYDAIAHLHGKKSLYNGGATTGWLNYLCESLFPSGDGVAKIFTLLFDTDPCGIVYPVNYHVLPPQANTWLANKNKARSLAHQVGLNIFPESYFDYPAGSMFWARPAAMQKLLSAGLKYSDFDPESGQTDGTLAHALERFFGLVVKDAGYRVGILQDEQFPTWSPWRLDRYFDRKLSEGVAAISDPEVRLVAFDIFDTLLCRPLLDPEMIKDLVAERVGGELAGKYLAYRREAESQARSLAGRDVGMVEIYAMFGKLAHCTATECDELRAAEEQLESLSLYPRPDGVALLHAALKAGKATVLLSDMFLPPNVIEAALQRYGILGWSKLYVSSDVGIRKDSGQLYQYVLKERGLKPAQVVMVGDNERSDWQIPTDLGMRTFHVLRAVDSARANLRFMPLLESVESERKIDDHLTLGLVIQGEFSAIFYPDRAPDSLVEVTPYAVGYGILGPLVASFAAWLTESNRHKSGVKLFFLAREGQALKLAYDAWAQKESGAPSSEYLVLSRRCVNVAAIKTFDDILQIARSDYFRNSVSLFLMERYGVLLSEERWRQVRSVCGWSADKNFEIKAGNLAEIEVLLRAVEQDIYKQAEHERPALMAYLKQQGLLDCMDPVLVDVGYSGTIQGALNRLLERAIRGQYMATDSGAEKIYPATGKLAEGCFADGVKRTPSAPFILRESFLLEKLLSSDDSQVMHYRLDADGRALPCHRALSARELAVRGVRAEVRAGMMAYLSAATDVRDKLKSDFQPSKDVANMLYEQYVAHSSDAELELSGKLVLDDFYCGRGLVS